jgi:hypothetical protein
MEITEIKRKKSLPCLRKGVNMPDMRQGGLANSSGNTLEQAVIATLCSKNFRVLYFRDYEKNKEKYGKEILLRNAPFISIYNHNGTTEFLLISEKYNLNLRIECKWQQSSGSVDEKFPYLYLNCLEAMPEKDIIIIIDGGGAKAGSIEWLKNTAKNNLYNSQNKEKNIQVMNLSEFIIWANKTFR